MGNRGEEHQEVRSGPQFRTQNVREVRNYVLTDLVETFFCVVGNFRVIAFVQFVNLRLASIRHPIENDA